MEVPDISKIFLSTPSARRATFGVLPVSAVLRYFYPRPPRGGRPTLVRGRGFEPHISIHALREEGDKTRYKSEINQWRFLSTPSARRATSYYDPMLANLGISIHALREEGDVTQHTLTTTPKKFLSTPSARRATSKLPKTYTEYIFLSTPSARRATARIRDTSQIQVISIHALREEGDPVLSLRPQCPRKFLSTPSARRATACS